jgi:diguanylate cyclase (GGDEF)-like protein
MASDDDQARRISDVFSTLTYRERYEDLLASARRDALTGVLDRGALETQGRMAVIKAMLAGRPVSLLVVDVDHFKEFNDRFGHAYGDIALRRIADTIVACVRPADQVFRFGGEEFVVICDGVNAAAARNLGERIRRDIASNTENAPGNTVSIGIGSCAEDASNYDDMFAIADRRLYEAKNGGRNCVVGRPVDGKSVRLAYSG